MIAKLIEPSGRIVAVKPANGRDFSLEEMQAFVGGYVEIITPELSKTGAVMVVNEDGKFRGLPINKIATAIWLEGAEKGSPRMSDPVVGNALLCHRSQIK